MFDCLHDPQSYALQDSQAYIRWLYFLLVARSDHTTGSRNMKPEVIFKVQKMARYTSFCLIMGPFKYKCLFFVRLWLVRVRVRVSFTTGSTVGHSSNSWASCEVKVGMHQGVEEWLVSAVMSMYTGAKTVVRTVYGNSNGFEVKVGMHQGSALSPLQFVIVMEALSREYRVALLWELLYTDDLVVIAETEDDLIKLLNE